METLIEHRKPVANRWRIRDDAAPAEAAPESSPPPGPVVAWDVVTLAHWRSLRERATDAGPSPIGVLLEPGDDPDELRSDLQRLALVAVRFPRFTDGRGYSIARLLRQQLGWTGPLMAVGDVLRDQLLLLERCGFDRFLLRADQDLASALSAFGDFSDAYQASASRVPLFARRRALEGALA